MQTIFDAGVEAGSAKPKRNDATQTIFVTLATSALERHRERPFLYKREPGFLEDMIEQPPMVMRRPRRSKSRF